MDYHHFLLFPLIPDGAFWNPEHTNVYICVSSFETMWPLKYQMNALVLGFQPNLYHISG